MTYAPEDSLTIVPHEELKCLWMVAGVISYRLCTRNYDCENCPLDRVLREGCVAEECPQVVRRDSFHLRINLAEELDSVPLDDPRLRPLFKPFERLTLRRKVFYGPGHSWVDVQAMDRSRAGADDLLRSMLPEIETIIPPSINQEVTQAEPVLWFIVEGEAVPFLSPLSGKIIEVNDNVLSDTELVHRDPYGTGWLVEITPTNLASEMGQLVYDEHAVEKLSQDAQVFCHKVVQHLQSAHDAVGQVSQDGGRPALTLNEVLGGKRYLKIIRSVLDRKTPAAGRAKQHTQEKRSRAPHSAEKHPTGTETCVS